MNRKEEYGIAPLRSSSSPYLAHVRRNDDGSFTMHDLEEHLRAVADLAGQFSSTFGHVEWGHLAGLWHDLGRCFAVLQNHPVYGNGIAIRMQRVEV